MAISDIREKVQIAVDDPMCGGVTSPDGRRVYNARDHLVELPAYEAGRILRSGGPASRYTRNYGMGRPRLDMVALWYEQGKLTAEEARACGLNIPS